MNIPRYWARASLEETAPDGSVDRFWAWGGSSISQEEAQGQANAKVQRIVQALAQGQTETLEYAYAEHPIREAIVDEVAGGGGRSLGVITRNRYGALVLNTESVCFVDIDFPSTSSGGFGLFRKKMDPAQIALERVRDWQRSHAQVILRVYRTAAGLRLALVDAVRSPDSEEVQAIFGELGADPLYCDLTAKQHCFRARLTPKPWRIELKNPPHRFPYNSEAELAASVEWQRIYHDRIDRFGVCQLVEVLGTPRASPEIDTVIGVHDAFTCADASRPLA